MKQNHLIYVWLVVLITMSALILSACGGTIKNLPEPTSSPTPAAEPVDVGEIPAVESTTTPLDIPTEDPNLEPTETPAVEDVCSLASVNDVENVLGQTVTSITPGAELDETSGSTINYCTYLGSGRAVVISSVEVENSFIGGDMLRAEIQSNQDKNSGTVTHEELGVGVKAYWSISEHAGEFTVLTEAHVFAVGLGGDIGNPLDHKAALLTLAQIVEKKQ